MTGSEIVFVIVLVICAFILGVVFARRNDRIHRR